MTSNPFPHEYNVYILSVMVEHMYMSSVDSAIYFIGLTLGSNKSLQQPMYLDLKRL
jgi:hypothetical protein